MKLIALSDLHGNLPEIKQKCDVVCICGDIFPLYIQKHFIKCLIWFSREFTSWVNSIPCEKVVFIAGNHDFFFERLIQQYKESAPDGNDSEWYDDHASDIITDMLDLPKKLVYLQDSSYTFNHVTFYGTPWCPDLFRWAFYGNSEKLAKRFSKIPAQVDILLTHTPGAEMFGTGDSHFSDGSVRMFGCRELTNTVLEKNVRIWLSGHIHTGNHDVCTHDNGMLVSNVSILDEDYDVRYEPLYLEFSKDTLNKIGDELCHIHLREK